MATQQRVLQVLAHRFDSGERPAVDVRGQVWEFGGVIFGGVSPGVALISPDGRRVSRSAAAWTKVGAKFVARSRDLNRGGGGVWWDLHVYDPRTQTTTTYRRQFAGLRGSDRTAAVEMFAAELGVRGDRVLATVSREGSGVASPKSPAQLDREIEAMSGRGR